MVWNRRAHDKVRPLIRWAEATIAADPVLRSASRAEQVACFARLMPDTTIGRHAVQHIEQALELHERRAHYNKTRPSAPGPHVTEMERQLRQILEGGLHATLNAGLRRLAELREARPGVTAMPRRPDWRSAPDAARIVDSRRTRKSWKVAGEVMSDRGRAVRSRGKRLPARGAPNHRR